MPQQTNLNVSPYFDDFNSGDNYYKVLFKPGYPIQARELNNLQSMLQNQTEQFGKNIFKDGSRVSGAEWKYDNPVNVVEIEDQFLGSPISLYFGELKGKKIRGLNSGVSARVVYILEKQKSDRSNYTLYVQYLESGGEDFTNSIFEDGETLITEDTIAYSNFTIQSGQAICSTISTNSTSNGSLFSISDGVYFVNGYFLNVKSDTIILDQYGVNPSYKVGFNILEKIISSDDDNRLFDNSQGFSNFAAPGSDRFSIELQLSKKDILDNDVDKFVEIFRVENGIPTFLDEDPKYNLIRDYVSKRTFDESGNFLVKPFNLFVRDSLNDRVLSDGIYFDNQKTITGSSPSEDMMIYQVSSGKAYVNGYDVEIPSTRLLETKKPRVTETISNQSIQYNAGTGVILNNVYGGLSIGLGTDATLSLIDSRVGGDPTVAGGSTIGVARIYDLIPETEYVDDTSRFQLRLFDIQTYTQIGITKSFDKIIPSSTYIVGKKSNATGFIKNDVSIGETTLTLYQVSGKFLENEPIIINGIEDGRLINFTKDYSISDIKSVYSFGFNADVVLGNRSYISKPGTSFTIDNNTITAGIENTFINIVNPGDIVSYFVEQIEEPIYKKVVSIGAAGTSFSVENVQNVSGVCNGQLNLPNPISVSNILKLTPSVESENSSLMTRLFEDNIESIKLEDTRVSQRRSFLANGDGIFSGSSFSITIPSEDIDVFFESFDEDRYYIYYSNGNIENVRSDKFNISTDGKTATFVGLSEVNGSARVIATVRNIKPNSKIKKFNSVSSIVVNKSKNISSGIGTTTLNDGLEYNSVYGLRVQDDQISLNYPDVVRVVAIYESKDLNDPQLPTIFFTATTGSTNTNQDFNVGEWIIGKSSGATALVVSRPVGDLNSLEYVYLNTFKFIIGEVIEGKESKVQSVITNLSVGDKNITKNYILDDGQRDTYYDYARIIRRKNVEEPKKKLKIIFQNYTIDPTDSGEFLSVNSYPKERFKYDVPYYENTRLTDFIDIRPRVAPYTLSLENSKSPFEFDSRKFDNSGQYSKYILVPNENIIASYSYYLGRIDRVFLNPNGTLEISEGIPGSVIPPSLKDNALDIATVYIPPYVYDVKNIIVDMSKYKRYRMQDISLLEDRIERVEKYTTLSMLESKTENFTIKDAESGLDRFKCGFFVDNFSNHDYHDLLNPIFNACIDKNQNTLRPSHYTTLLDLQLGSEVISGVSETFSPGADQSYVSDLGSPGIKKTGDLITLNYEEKLYFEQVFATKSESVTPFLVRYWLGSIELNPPIDTWIDETFFTTNSFNENVVTREPLPDENITVVNDVVVNEEVFVNSPIVNTGIPGFDWITNARTVLGRLMNANRFSSAPWNMSGRAFTSTRVRNLSQIGGGNWTRVGANFIRLVFNADRNSDTPENRQTIRDLLPPDLANQFITALGTRTTTPRRITLNFIPGQPPVIGEDRNVTTTTQSTSNTTTIVLPPQISSDDTISESESNYTEVVRFLRSRNIEFDIKGLRPRTRFYPFFEGIDVNSYIIPKLLEIEMINGAFEIGETVETDPNFTGKKISFRLCKPNHKTGSFDGSSSSNDTFTLNPYTLQPIPENYTESSTFLNVDTRSLQLPSETEYFGLVAENMRLIGKTTGSVARITNIRLISDSNGRLIGSLFIPDPNNPGNPRWVNGQNTFTVIDVNSLELSQSEDSTSSAESEFTSSGTNNVTERNILTTRNITIIPGRRVNTTTITNTTTNTTTVTQTNQPGESTTQSFNVEAFDPLAQSFYVKEDTGIFLTSVEVYFETKDDTVPVTLQIRPMINGVPSNTVVPFSEVTLDPDKINLSTDGTISTKFTFPSPVYLSGPQQLEIRSAPIGSQQTSEYAIVLLSNSPQYRVFISELGFNDITTGVKLTDQATLGSLFKSQNGSVWNPSQFEDLKYKLNRADFVTEGIVRFFNPELSLKNKKVTVTGENQVLPLSKRIMVGLGSTGYDATKVVPGVTITQENASGKLIGISGSILLGTDLGTEVSNPGFGYTEGTFAGVELKTETGSGKGVVATIGVTTVGISTVTITNGGFGYQVGDSLLIPEIGLGQNVGFGGKLTVSSLESNNTLVIDNVQGTFSVGINTVYYENSAGIAVSLGVGVSITNIFDDPFYDGLHMKISHLNHGMHSTENFVKIDSFRPLQDQANSKTVVELTENSIELPLVSSEGFETFEGLPVSPTNLGYVIIGNEVIAYENVFNNILSLTNVESGRGVDGTFKQLSYEVGTPVYKYEFNGVSLRRINTLHNFAEVDTVNHPIDLNSYYIKIDNGSDRGKDRTNNLFFKETVQSGRTGTIITNNIQYEAITPRIATILPSKTNLTSRIRTVSGTSIGGNEKSFIDEGFKSISLDSVTYFSSPKIICSKVNEERFITETPGNKSLTMELLMNTTDSRVSPVVDTIQTSVILTSNLINNPLGIEENSNYANDDRVRSLYNDPHSTIYISKPVRLKIPANSLKVLLSSSRTTDNDVRVLYQLFRDDSPQISNNFELFPGYSNYRIDGIGIKRVIDPSINDGSADFKVQQTSDASFKDYEYSVDDLPDFNAFAIKIVMSSSNQAIPPLIKELRAIATIKPKI